MGRTRLKFLYARYLVKQSWSEYMASIHSIPLGAVRVAVNDIDNCIRREEWDVVWKKLDAFFFHDKEKHLQHLVDHSIFIPNGDDHSPDVIVSLKKEFQVAKRQEYESRVFYPVPDLCSCARYAGACPENICTIRYACAISCALCDRSLPKILPERSGFAFLNCHCRILKVGTEDVEAEIDGRIMCFLVTQDTTTGMPNFLHKSRAWAKNMLKEDDALCDDCLAIFLHANTYNRFGSVQ